jgi:hypothetical protein
MSQHETDYLTKFSVIGTVVFITVGTIASIQSAFEIIFVILSLAMFTIGVTLGMKAFAKSVSRSRYEIIMTIDLIKLPQGTPRKPKIKLYGSLGAEVIGSILFASLQSSTNFAFGILASLFALGNLNMWAIMNGRFQKRPNRKA